MEKCYRSKFDLRKECSSYETAEDETAVLGIGLFLWYFGFRNHTTANASAKKPSKISMNVNYKVHFVLFLQFQLYFEYILFKILNILIDYIVNFLINSESHTPHHIQINQDHDLHSDEHICQKHPSKLKKIIPICISNYTKLKRELIFQCIYKVIFWFFINKNREIEQKYIARINSNWHAMSQS